MPSLHTRRRASLALVALIAATPYVAHAQGHVTDPMGDFIPSFTGPKTNDLDVLDAWFTFDGNNFHFRSRQAAPIDPTSGHLFVWGVNRGAGTAGFPLIAPGVLFDAVLAINPGAAVNQVRDLKTGIGTPLPVGAVSFNGDFLDIIVPKALLSSTGASFDMYTANLWPRSGAGGQEVIADFAPDNSNIAVQVTPEPATLLLVAPLLLGIGAVRRRATTIDGD